MLPRSSQSPQLAMVTTCQLMVEMAQLSFWTLAALGAYSWILASLQNLFELLAQMVDSDHFWAPAPRGAYFWMRVSLHNLSEI